MGSLLHFPNKDTRTPTLDWVTIIAPTVTGSISVICSMLLIIRFIRFRKSSLKCVKERLLLGLSISDVIFSTACAMSTWAGPAYYQDYFDQTRRVRKVYGNEATCNVQGWLYQLGSMSPMYSACLVVYFYLAICKQKRDSEVIKWMEPTMHIIIWLWGIMTASIAVGLDFIVMADLGGCHITRSIITYKSRCEIEPSFPECNDDRNAYNVGINVFAVFYVPPYAVSIFLIIVLMTMIYCKKWKCGNCLNQCECPEIDCSMDGSEDFFAPISPATQKLNPYADFLGEDSKCPEGDYEVPSNVASYNHPQTVPEYIPLTNLTDQVSGMTIEGGIKSPYSPSDIRSSESRRLSNTSLYLISSEVLDKKIPEEIRQSLGPIDGENQVPPDSGINPLENERPSHCGGDGDDGGDGDVPSRGEQSHHTQKEGPEDSKREQITKRPSNNDGAMANDMKETGFQYVLGFFLTYTITIINTANITEDLLLMEFLGILLLPSQGIWNFIFYTRGRMKTIRANNRKKTFRQVLWDAVFA